ncbi:MAG TPA: SRPBCC family protein, partial [Methylomirabilota bacterium]|nr:SRPBCC family protein [Methylomirabilota bacterium]
AAWVATQRRGAHDGDPGHRRRPDVPTLARDHGERVERTVTVTRPAMEVYRVWRDLRRLPEFMPHLESVTPLSETRSRWVACGPGGMTVEWEAEIMADEPGRLIAWRSVHGDVDNAGSVRFSEAPGTRGSEVKVQLRYAPPAGQVGAALATVFGHSADRQLREDLRRFKQVLEAGEIANPGRLAPNGRRR